MNCYILICNDADPKLIAAPSAYALADYRLRRRVWALNQKTPHRQHLQAGDRVLIYLSGKRKQGRSFVARAEVAMRPYTTNERLLNAPDLMWDRSDGYAMRLGKVAFFQRPVALSETIQRLSFIPKNKHHLWWHYLRGGCRRIDAKDFDTIVRLSETSGSR